MTDREKIEGAVFSYKSVPLIKMNGRKAAIPIGIQKRGALKPKQVGNIVAKFAINSEKIVVFCGSVRDGLLFADDRFLTSENLNYSIKENLIEQPIFYKDISKVEVDEKNDSYFILYYKDGNIKRGYGSIYTYFIANALTNILNALGLADSSSAPQEEMREQPGKEVLDEVMADFAAGYKFSAFKNLKKGAKKYANAEMYYQLGLCYKNEIGVDKDEKEAVKWFKKAVGLGHPQAKVACGYTLLSTNKYEQSFPFFIEAARQGNIRAMEGIEQCLGKCISILGVRGEHENTEESVKRRIYEEIKLYWYFRMIECGAPEKGYEGIDELIRKWELRKQTDKRRLYAQKLIVQGCRNQLKDICIHYPLEENDAEYWRQQVSETEERMKKAKTESEEAEKIRIAKEKQDKEADDLYERALTCLKEGNPKEGMDLLLRAAESGHIQAMKYLLQKEADSGNADAQYKVGLCLLTGTNGFGQNEAEAFSRFEQAAGQDHMDARYQLALCHIRGAGTPVDETKGWQLMEEAGKGGSLPAQVLLGDRYCHGSQRDAEKAEQYLLPITKMETQNDMIRFCQKEAYYSLAALYSYDGTKNELYEELPQAMDCALNFCDLSITPEDRRWKRAFGGIPYRNYIEPARQDDIQAIEALQLYIQSRKKYSALIVRIFRMWKIKLYTPQAQSGDRDAMYHLYEEYGYLGNSYKSREWGEKAIAAKHPDMLMDVYNNPKEWNVSAQDRGSYLYDAYKAGNERAIIEWEAIDLEEELAEREEKRAQQVRDYQAFMGTNAYKEKLDSIEREINGLTTGNWNTAFEQALTGQMSQQDYLRHEALRDMLEKRHNKN